MRYLVIFGLYLLTHAGFAQSFFDQANDFFAKNVKDGMVNYAAIKEDPAELRGLVRHIAELDLSNRRVTPEFLKAFYINAYNLLVIKQVVDLYPIEGPLKVDGFFNGIKHKVMGKPMTLDELEKGTLYQQFPDPRLHFVLVCAAKGCPPLVARSYQPDGLDNQLTDRTRAVLNLDWFIVVNNRQTEVSQIFSWYKDDFVKASGSVVDYINHYRDKAIPSDAALNYYEYDWSLNEI